MVHDAQVKMTIIPKRFVDRLSWRVVMDRGRGGTQDGPSQRSIQNVYRKRFGCGGTHYVMMDDLIPRTPGLRGVKKKRVLFDSRAIFENKISSWFVCGIVYVHDAGYRQKK